MIQSFASKDTESIWQGQYIKAMHRDLQRKALDKLRLLNRAQLLSDLRIPPGNRLEPLHGDRAGQHSIRINDQWRICFRWTAKGPEGVEVTDYH